MALSNPAHGWFRKGGAESAVTKKLQNTIASFSFFEKMLFFAFLGALVVGALGLLLYVNNSFLVTVPAHGGGFTEGIVGTPRFINPLLALSDSDRDLSALLYAGLMKADPDGSLVPELAEGYNISDDGLSYTFTLKENLRFHDGTPLTADDVVYTLSLAQNPALKSPKRPNWEGVLVEKVDDRTIRFTLAEEYSPFLENMTIGIVPKHIWQDTPVEQHPFSTYNIEPVGAGPFEIKRVRRSSDGIPTEYTLEPFSDYALGKPYLDEIRLIFYDNEESLLRAVRSGDVDNAYALLPQHARELAESGFRIESFPLPRVFAVFFNQDQAPLFTNREVRVALNRAVDRNRIVEKVLAGYGTPTTSPLPPSHEHTSTVENDGSADLEGARAILSRNGWEEGDSGILIKETRTDDYELSFSIATANTPELKSTAEALKEQWGGLGASVSVELFDTGNLNNDVIRPRNYTSLLFGQIIGRNLDPYAFWHSSQRNDPGLNVALYANITTDDVLEDIRTTTDRETRESLYAAFEEEIENDVPAVFVYAPDFTYVLKKNIKGFKPGVVTTSGERFQSVHEWHIYTEHVWGIFADN